MQKRFTRKPQGDDPATRGKNYITPSGLQRLKEEHHFLLTRERPAVTKVVAWAASNGDRSENADYQYGKRRLRQNRWAYSLSHKANRSRGSGGPGKPESGASGDASILWSDRPICQCRRNGTSGEHCGHRRGRSKPQPHQLGVTSGASVAQVGSRGPRCSRSPGR